MGLARALRDDAAEPELDRCTEDLLAFGGSSGADTLAGLLSAVRIERKPHILLQRFPRMEKEGCPLLREMA